jgi:hypothetical protein
VKICVNPLSCINVKLTHINGLCGIAGWLFAAVLNFINLTQIITLTKNKELTIEYTVTVDNQIILESIYA